jgi:hypothetical protein
MAAWWVWQEDAGVVGGHWGGAGGENTGNEEIVSLNVKKKYFFTALYPINIF